MKTIEELRNAYVAPIVEAHAECRWCDAGELEEMLNEAYIAGATASQEWISVDDGLPPVSDNDILIKGIDDRGVSGIADIGYMHSPGTGAEHIISLAGVLITVTHWRPIEYK